MQNTIVSRTSTGGASDGMSFGPYVSADGTHVAYGSYATNLVEGDDNFAPDVFRYDASSDTTSLVSRALDGTVPDAASSSFPAISGDGSTVTFTSDATDLVPGTRRYLNRIYAVEAW